MASALTFTEVGGHRQNEDAAIVQQHPADPTVWICAVADGQGGQAGGGPAARLACKATIDAAAKCDPPNLLNPAVWSSILRTADEAVRLDAEAGFTTLIGLCVNADRIVGASSGDSAALLVNAEEETKLTFGQHKNPPIGSGGAFAVPFMKRVRTPWQLLVMTDGVWKYAGWGKITETALRERGSSLIEELQKAARLPGSGEFQDDFSIVLLADEGDAIG